MQTSVMKTTAIVHVHNNGLNEGAESDETEKSACCNAAFTSFKDAINAETSHTNLVIVEAEGPGKHEAPQSAGDKEDAVNDNENESKDDVPELTTSSLTKLSIPETVAIMQPINLLTVEKEAEISSTKLNIVNDIALQNEVVPEVSAEEESSTSIRKVVISKRVGILKASIEDSSSGEGGTKNNNKKIQSYPEMVSKRKNLIKIHRITDSDNRTRAKMKKKGLSPPSSSDGENWYIGFIAYPSNESETESFRTAARRKSRDIACFAFKCIFSPVTKMCEMCRRNKVGDDGQELMKQQ